MNAKQVYELVKDIPSIDEWLPDVCCLAFDGSHWIYGSLEEPFSPAHALDLIVGACKREMGEDYRGCCRDAPTDDCKEWVCEFFYRNNPDDSNFSRDGDTEAAAVIAAWRAWKEEK